MIFRKNGASLNLSRECPGMDSAAAQWIFAIDQWIKFVSFIWLNFDEVCEIFNFLTLMLSALFPQPNKIAVMTGGNRGIGLDVLKKLLQCEMTVVCGVRNPDGCREIVEKSFDESLWNGKIFYEKCDTSDMGSVREFARKVQAKFTAVNLLINNGKFCLCETN